MAYEKRSLSGGSVSSATSYKKRRLGQESAKGSNIGVSANNLKIKIKMGRGMRKGQSLIKKGRWSSDEDDKLLALVKEQQGLNNAEIDWGRVELQFKTRSKKQCRERWLSQLDPTLKKTEWTPDEDELLLDLSDKLSKKWAEIARRIPGRTENMVKNRWHALDRMASGSRHQKRKRDKRQRVEVEAIKPEPRIVKRVARPIEMTADQVVPLSCISNKRTADVDPLNLPKADSLSSATLMTDLLRIPSFDVDKSYLTREPSLPFGDKPDVIKRHPSFDTNAIAASNLLDRQVSTDSLKSVERQASYDFLFSPSGALERVPSFDSRRFPFDRQQSLGVSQISHSVIDDLFLQERM